MCPLPGGGLSEQGLASNEGQAMRYITGPMLLVTVIVAASSAGCGGAWPAVPGEADGFLALDATQFGCPEALPALGNSVTAAKNTVVIPDDLILEASDEITMSINVPQLEIGGTDAGRPNPRSSDGAFHATITFHLAPRGEDACSSPIVSGPYELTQSRGKITIDKTSLPLSEAAAALVRTGQFEICAETSADFDGALSVNQLIIEFGRLHPSDTRVEICHLSPGEPEARHTITIASSALQAHLDKGCTVGACPVAVQPLELTAACSDDPALQRRWKITNLNGSAVAVNWEIYGTAQAGSLSAAAGESYFLTDAVEGANTCLIRWPDENGVIRSAVKASDGATCNPDGDGDGVFDSMDICAGTAAGEPVNADGCSCAQRDPDSDGVNACLDNCPETPAGETADAAGCSCSQYDEDADGINDCEDLCPGTPGGTPVDAVGCEVMLADAGADTVLTEVGPVTLQASAAGGTPPYRYAWTAPGWAGSSSQNPSVLVSATTTFTLTVTDWSFPPQTAIDTVTITVAGRQALRYTIADLGSLASRNSYATAVNDAGQVVGRYVTDTWATRPFLYANGSMIDLGTLGGTSAEAVDINGAGEVVGTSDTASGQRHGFIWDAVHHMRDLGTLAGSTSEAYAINDAGQVAGYAENGSGYQAFVYSGGVMTAMDMTGYSQSAAFDINADGYLAGILLPAVGDSVAFMRDSTLHDLGSPLLSASEAWLINDSGLVVGHSWASGQYRSFLYAAGAAVDLGGISGFAKTYAWGLSPTGQIVGNVSNNSGTPLSHAFVYTGGAIYDLNDLLVPGHGWEYLVSANGVNRQGQIVGYGKINGQYRAFLLTPVP
jgi:probable HAF family extracellular repeat protein